MIELLNQLICECEAHIKRMYSEQCEHSKDKTSVGDFKMAFNKGAIAAYQGRIKTYKLYIEKIESNKIDT